MATRSIPALSNTRTISSREAALRLWALAIVMVQTRTTRRILAEMDDRQLADIGVSRGDARTEASRRLWDLAPRSRR